MPCKPPTACNAYLAKRRKRHSPRAWILKVPYDATKFVRAAVSDVILTLVHRHRIGHLRRIRLPAELARHAHPAPHHTCRHRGNLRAFSDLLGFSINMTSMFGLVLAIGIVVDDAIVVVEAVQLNLDNGMSPRDAVIKAMEEVSSPIVAIALILAAVFIPVAFLGGISGQIFRQFALTIAAVRSSVRIQRSLAQPRAQCSAPSPAQRVEELSWRACLRRFQSRLRLDPVQISGGRGFPAAPHICRVRRLDTVFIFPHRRSFQNSSHAASFPTKIKAGSSVPSVCRMARRLSAHVQVTAKVEKIVRGTTRHGRRVSCLAVWIFSHPLTIPMSPP